MKFRFGDKGRVQPSSTLMEEHFLSGKIQSIFLQNYKLNQPNKVVSGDGAIFYK